ncbi:MAG: hypothetical protein IPP42_05290 [Saprospiraceae bacterium]|nr:hypothetical protein [Saprospiraceae bacterium]
MGFVVLAYLTATGWARSQASKISIDGGTPYRVFGDYFSQYDHNLIELPGPGELFFSDT